MAEATTKEAPTYHVDRLIAESSDRFGQPSHVAAGAFDGGRKQNYTVDEAQSLIDKWLKKEVEVDNPITTTEEEG